MASEVPLPISFDEQKKDQYRGNTQVVSRAMEQSALDLKSDQMSGKNASIQAQTQAFGGKSHEIVTLVMDEAGVQSKLQKGTQNIYALRVTQEAPQTEVFNEISSFNAKKMNETQVINKLSDILLSYNGGNEIDFEIDGNKNEIKNGVVFINNYYSVFFTFWTNKNDDGSTQFEFRRQSGDALASAKFLGDIKSKFFGADEKKSDDEKEANSLIGLDLNVSGMAELKVSDNDKEMMMIHEALIDDEFVGDSLEQNAENYLYQQLVQNKAVSKEHPGPIDHKILCKTLMNKSLLLHRDIAVIRASLLILTRFVNVYNDLLCNKELMALIQNVIKQNKCKIVKRYAVKLLAEIAESNKNNWDISNELKENLKKEIKDFEKMEQGNKNYDEKMFNSVYNKL